MGHGEKLTVCADCWNESVDARRAARKAQLSEHWEAYRVKQAGAMESAGAEVGQRVEYFAASMLGGYFGGITIRGTIVLNRNRIAVVKLDNPGHGPKYTAWHKGWKLAGGAQ